jgi:hypothetical protein
LIGLGGRDEAIKPIRLFLQRGQAHGNQGADELTFEQLSVDNRRVCNRCYADQDRSRQIIKVYSRIEQTRETDQDTNSPHEIEQKLSGASLS